MESVSQSGCFNRHTLIAFLLCGSAASSILDGTPAHGSERTLTFAERVAYQYAIEQVYWRHRIWPKENSNPKPSLDQVMPRQQIEMKVVDYLRKSQALDNYWQRPITAEQLQAEMERMTQRTKQPEVLQELFAALGNDPFVIAECVARPALAERLITNWYGYDQRIHGELKAGAEADLRTHSTTRQMKQQFGGRYSEIEVVKSSNSEKAIARDVKHGVKLNSREWDETVRKLSAMFGGHSNGIMQTNALNRVAAAGGLPPKAVSMAEIRTGVLSPLQEEETSYYAMAVLEKSRDLLKLARITWLKEPVKLWLARTQDHPRSAIITTAYNYTLPSITGTADVCADDTWTSTLAPPRWPSAAHRSLDW